MLRFASTSTVATTTAVAAAASSAVLLGAARNFCSRFRDNHYSPVWTSCSSSSSSSSSANANPSACSSSGSSSSCCQCPNCYWKSNFQKKLREKNTNNNMEDKSSNNNNDCWNNNNNNNNVNNDKYRCDWKKNNDSKCDSWKNNNNANSNKSKDDWKKNYLKDNQKLNVYKTQSNLRYKFYNTTQFDFLQNKCHTLFGKQPCLDHTSGKLCDESKESLQRVWKDAQTVRDWQSDDSSSVPRADPTSAYCHKLFYLANDLKTDHAARAERLAKQHNIEKNDSEIRCVCCGRPIEQHLTKEQLVKIQGKMKSTEQKLWVAARFLRKAGLFLACALIFGPYAICCGTAMLGVFIFLGTATLFVFNPMAALFLIMMYYILTSDNCNKKKTEKGEKKFITCF